MPRPSMGIPHFGTSAFSLWGLLYNLLPNVGRWEFVNRPGQTRYGFEDCRVQTETYVRYLRAVETRR